jgi:hypothetical protein
MPKAAKPLTVAREAFEELKRAFDDIRQSDRQELLEEIEEWAGDELIKLEDASESDDD